MKNYLIKLSILISLMLPMSAFAVQDVSLGSGLIISAGGENITVSGTSNPDQLVVNSGSFTLTISNNTSVTLVDTSKSTMTFSQPAGANQLTTALTCNSGNSTYVIGNPTAGATGLQITVTPTGTSCGASSGGGSGSSGGAGAGGGGGAAPSPSPAPVPVSTPPTSTIVLPNPGAPTVPLTTGTQHAAQVMLSRPLKLGEKSDDAKAVQDILEAQGFLKMPNGVAKGVFGGLTKEAIKKFQKANKIAKEGQPGFGELGPKTRAKLNELNGNTTTSIDPLLQKLADLQALLKSLKK